MSKFLPYNPGKLPTQKAPLRGEEINIKVDGLPPVKKQRISLRNPKNPNYKAFVDLRNAATEAMGGKAWYFGPISLDLIIYTNQNLEFKLNEYTGGVFDTLDGSSGDTFTYLPIVYEDDCQVASGSSSIMKAQSTWYELKIKFL